MLSARKKKEQKINLLPQEEFAASSTGRILHWLLSTFRYLVIGTEMIVIAAFISRFYFDSRNADLDDEIGQKQQYIEAYSNFEQEFRTIQDKLQILSVASTSQEDTSLLAETIVSKLPIDIELVRINLSDDQFISILGASLSEQSIQQLVINLSADSLFESASLQQVDSKANTPFINFIINVKLANL